MNNKKLKKPKEVGQNIDLWACPRKNIMKRDASGNKRRLLCWKCFCEQRGANLANIRAENVKNV